MTYWIGVDTPEVFEEANRKDNLSEPHRFGFPTGRRKFVERMQVGDRIVNYMTRRKVFFAVWQITERHEHRPEYILDDKPFPECVTVIPEVLVPPEKGVSFDRIKTRLKAFGELKNSKRWSVLVRPSARPFKYDDDGETILNALRDAKGNNQGSSLEAGQEIARQRMLAEQSARPAQQEFSTMLRQNYQGRCAITECSTSVALEAAHIRVQKGVDDNSPENGLLLRADIHALFDALLITLSEDGARVEVSDALTDPSYAFLRNAMILQPVTGCRPSRGNIRDHRSRFFAKHWPMAHRR